MVKRGGHKNMLINGNESIRKIVLLNANFYGRLCFSVSFCIFKFGLGGRDGNKINKKE